MTPDAEAEVRASYSAFRAQVSATIPITVLHIGPEQTAIAGGDGTQSPVTLALDIGSKKTARDYFQHIPPTPVEMENAIAGIEDQVMRVRTVVPKDPALFTTDAAVREIALVAGVPDSAEMTLTLDAMEQTFERLVAVTLGKTALREGIPTGNEFAAALLILREIMHHLQYQAITALR